ncbi:hypothetical protein [Haloarcula marina]|uniref:hypothetical protein n=1 Tax=Haloarcula marina TaxID=2961574 RepID=UPI0020B84C2B|nr:hypothetical protein [Halomicroarcula marina]
MREAHRQSVDGHITVLCIDDDTEYLDALQAAFEDVADIELVVDADPATALDRLDDVDCVVSAIEASTTDGGPLLETVREQDPTMPLLFTTSQDLSGVEDTLFEVEAVDFHPRNRDGPAFRLFERRLRNLVARSRLEHRTLQFRTALDLSQELTLVVSGDGRIAYANQPLSSAVTADRNPISGRHWTDIFTDESVRHLRVEAFPVIEDGWNWTGTTVLRSHTGDIEARTSLVRLADRSLVFVFHALSRDDETCC